ncbi:MAG: hypothetical protein QFX35_01300 [Candidatus Verstraetearchaeota archaeon]|nr:hypothetical protein [Candidatus Verstraetearchaeota archaeon]
MVKSVSKVVQELIDQDPPLQDAMRRGYANYSSVARMLSPKVSEVLGRKVKLAGITTSVRRARLGAQDGIFGVNRVVAGSILNVRTDVAKLSVQKSERTLKALQGLLEKFWNDFLQILVGSTSITIILDQRMVGSISPRFDQSEVLDRKENLAALMIQSPGEIIDTPGCISAFYSALSRIGVNIEETVSCFTDTIVVISTGDVAKALSCLTDLISTARSTPAREHRQPPRRKKRDVRAAREEAA